jgi:hypothetical protein
VLTQLTAFTLRVESMSTGVDQVVPLKSVASPEVSTATQKVELVQLTASIVLVESASTGVDHVVPLYGVA